MLEFPLCEVFEEAGHSTIALLIDSAMNLQRPNGVKRDNALLLETDAVLYMVKTAKGLKMLHPEMVHLTCIV